MSYNHSTTETLRISREICEEYADLGMRVTVRQLYYQFVSRGLEANGQKVYKPLVSILSKARLDGLFPMDLIEDRGRTVTTSNIAGEFSVRQGVAATARDLREAPSGYLWSGMWFGQPTVPVVWVEKEALSGVFEEPCTRLDVGLFACKG